MRIGIIDLGTNSVRFDVRQLGPGTRTRQLHREKIMIRLGQGVFLNGKLDRSAVQRTLHSFRRFKRIATGYKVSKIIAFGTSALREVSDRDRFLELLFRETGIQVRVISGLEEAQLISLGISTKEKLGKKPVALVDIGGGSTEISVCRGKKMLHAHSFLLGTARLQQVFLKKIPPNEGSIEELRQHIRASLSQVITAGHWPKVEGIVGSSGTIKALAKILGTEGTRTVERSALSDSVAAMSSMTTTELLGISGIESKRVDMILAGAILFEEIMHFLSVKKARTTEYSLRDGILAEEQQLFLSGLKGKASHFPLHLPDVREKAIQFGVDGDHVDRVVDLSERIFDTLRPLHRLDPTWKPYLSAAVMLRNIGESVNLAHYEEHSCYIVRNSDFSGAEAWENEFIAELCLYHAGTKAPVLESPLLKGAGRKSAFIKLLAILRVVDALDSGPETHIRLDRVRLGRRAVDLFFSGRGLTGLESLQVEKRAPYFERVFKSELSAVQRTSRRS
ncbi:MAG: Ppx/GppA phosphatase family protein [Oligoflexia bacterium]|nr:Ppx/GppA phosphatase family protein [Oligoflexia bacterium]